MSVEIIDIHYVLSSLLLALWIMLPAYVPNSAAALFGGGRPIDLGKTLSDGKRIFGDGKTFRGFFGGVMSGILVGSILILLQYFLNLEPIHTPLSVILLATGALLGDLIKSFFKRRLDKKRGESWLIADQYDLVAGAFALLLIVYPEWVWTWITPAVAVWIIVITPLLHRGVNIIGYLLGVKDVPW